VQGDQVRACAPRLPRTACEGTAGDPELAIEADISDGVLGTWNVVEGRPYHIARALLAPPARIADNRPMILAPNQPLDALLCSLGIVAVCPWLPETRALMPREPAALS
jgi:hypothetical protein